MLAEVLTLVLMLLSAYLGSKLRKANVAIRYVINALETTEKAIEDGQVTPEEVKEMIKAWKEVLKNV